MNFREILDMPFSECDEETKKEIYKGVLGFQVKPEANLLYIDKIYQQTWRTHIDTETLRMFYLEHIKALCSKFVEVLPNFFVNLTNEIYNDNGHYYYIEILENQLNLVLDCGEQVFRVPLIKDSLRNIFYSPDTGSNISTFLKEQLNCMDNFINNITDDIRLFIKL